MAIAGGYRGWWWRCLPLMLALMVLVAGEPDAPRALEIPASQELVVAGLRLELPAAWTADEDPAGGCLAVWRDGASGLVLAAARAPRRAMGDGFTPWVAAERQALTQLGEHGVEIVEDQPWQGRDLSGWVIAYRFSFIGRRWYHRAHLLQIDSLGLIITLAGPADQQAVHHDQMQAISASFSPATVSEGQGRTP